MMKHHTALCTLLAATVGVPMLIGQEGDLLARLTSTQNAITEIAGLRPGLASRDAQALTRLLEISVDPLPPTPARDQQIMAARTRVASLRMELDRIESEGIQKLIQDPSRTDLSQADRDAATVGHGPATQLTPRSREAKGYSADPMREAQLLVSAKRFTEALTVLKPLSATAQVRYWRATAISGLGQTDKALTLYRALANEAEQSDYKRWATQEVKLIEIGQRLRGLGDNR
jgi:hypothetical protein